MPSLKITQLSIEEVKQAIINNKLQDINILSFNQRKLYDLSNLQLGAIMRFMQDGSAFIRIEVCEDDRTEK